MKTEADGEDRLSVARCGMVLRDLGMLIFC